MTEDIYKEIKARARDKQIAKIYSQKSILLGSINSAPGINNHYIIDLDKGSLGILDNSRSFKGFIEELLLSKQLEGLDQENQVMD